MTSLPKDSTPPSLPETFLALANDEYQEHRIHRGYYASVARAHGITNQRIAEIYGVTEGAVRAMIKRHEASPSKHSR